MLKPIVILGPTAIGKTSTAIKLSNIIDAEIISSDSAQIYKYMNIGTAKPTIEEMKSIRHHLLNIRLPNETFSSGEFVKEVKKLIKDIISRNKNVIIVGGGGFYIDSLVYGMDEISEIDEKIKRFFDDVCDELSSYHLYKLLKIVDDNWADQIKPQDCQRIKRGLSVYFDKQKELSGFFSLTKNKHLSDYTIFVLHASRSFINQRIEERVDNMVNEGLIDEVKKLVDMGFSNTNALKAIGYKEVLDYLVEEIDKKTMINLIKKNTKAYAKRQLTLLRSRFNNAVWINVEKEDSLKAILDFWRPFP